MLRVSGITRPAVGLVLRWSGRHRWRWCRPVAGQRWRIKVLNSGGSSAVRAAIAEGGVVEAGGHHGWAGPGPGRCRTGAGPVRESSRSARRGCIAGHDRVPLRWPVMALGLLPQPPGQRTRGQALGVTVVGQRVEEGVGRGVIGLPGAPIDPGDRGEQHERDRSRSRVNSCRCQAASTLAAQHRVEAFGGQRGDHPVVEHPGGVDHRAQRRVLSTELPTTPSSASRSADITGHHLGLRRRDRPDRPPARAAPSACVPAPAGQQQVTHPVRADQMTGQRRHRPSRYHR